MQYLDKLYRKFEPYFTPCGYIFGGNMMGAILAWFSSAYNVLGFFPSLLICVSLGMFISICLMVWREHKQELEKIIKKNFSGETVEIDGKHFISCQFDNCKLVYGGGNYDFDKSDVGQDCKLMLSNHVCTNVAKLFQGWVELAKNSNSEIMIFDEYDRPIKVGGGCT